MEMMQSTKSKAVRGACLLSADEDYDYVLIRQGGAVYTGGYTLRIKARSGLLIEGAGLLNVNAAGGSVVLDVPGTTEGGTHIVDGEIRLTTSTSVLQIRDDVVLAGGGAIIGSDNGAEISVDGGRMLTSQLRIEGIVTIAGTADAITGFFHNEGWVVADSASARILLEDLTFRGRGEWRVGPTSGTEIEFAATADATQLAGDFVVFDGTLDIPLNAIVITSGHLHWVDGSIVVGSGVAEFRAN